MCIDIASKQTNLYSTQLKVFELEFEPLMPQVAHDRDNAISYYGYKLEYLVVSGHVMAIYLKWHMCPCHEPLVAQIQFVWLARVASKQALFIFIRV